MDQAQSLRHLMRNTPSKLVREDLSLPVYSMIVGPSVRKGRNFSVEIMEAVSNLGSSILYVSSQGGPSNGVNVSHLSVGEVKAKRWENEDYELLGVDAILLDAGRGVSEEDQELHSPYFNTVLVLGEMEKDLLEAQGWMRVLKRRVGVKKVIVFVEVLDEAGNGERAFSKLWASTRRFFDGEVIFGGTLKKNENLNALLQNENFLINLKQDSPAQEALMLPRTKAR